MNCKYSLVAFIVVLALAGWPGLSTEHPVLAQEPEPASSSVSLAAAPQSALAAATWTTVAPRG